MNTAEKHLAAIRAGRIEKTNVIGIRKAINSVERERQGWSPNRNAATFADVRAMEEAIDAHHPRVVGELHETGLKVLRNRRYAKRLADYATSIAAADHFCLVRFDRIGRHGEYAVPVYAVWSKIPPKGDALDGGTYEAFRFRNIPWQSGGDGPEVVS